MNEMIIFDIKTTDTINVLCYEGDYNTIYENEEKLCHYFKIKPIDKDIIGKVNNKLIDYVMYINENNMEIEFYNFDNGDSILFRYIELNEINYGHEEIIKAKIKYLVNESNGLNKILKNKKIELNNIVAYLNKELGNTNRKIGFFEKNNNTENLFKNIGKKEMIENILDKINKK